jgi:4-aminobutyrate aminotransferase-like enzyme
MHGQLPVVWDHAEDFHVFDKHGNRWIDFTSTIFVANCGHSNSSVVKALKEQIDSGLMHTYTFASEIRIRFLKKLIEITPPFCEKAFLLSAGTEAVECALKLMRMYGRSVRDDKKGIISFTGCMHGRTMAAEMMKGDPRSSEWIGYTDPNMFHLPFPYTWLAENSKKYNWRKHFQKDITALLKRENTGPDNICGIMIESYQGWGAIMYPEEYIQELVNFACKHDILVTFDEIQGGFGRTGKMFVYEHYGVEPDLLCLGKALSGGVPLSAVIGRQKILDLPETGSMSSTHSANPLCCAAALANIEEIVSKDLIRESEQKGRMLHSYLNDLKEKYPGYISYIFGKGLLAAIIVTDPETYQPNGLIASRVCEKAMQKGLLLVHTGRESIKIGPPLTMPKEAIVEAIGVIAECFQEIKDETKEGQT